MKWLLLPLLIMVSNAHADPLEAIVLGGGHEKEDAEKAISAFNAADATKVHAAKGYPRIFSEDDLPGTPKDTYVAVLGFCDRATSGPTIDHAIRAITTGAFSRTLSEKHDLACPSLAPEVEEQLARQARPKAKPRKRR